MWLCGYDAKQTRPNQM